MTGLIVQHTGECNSMSDICRAANDTASLDLPYACASDGNTYINLFAFWCVKLDKPGMSLQVHMVVMIFNVYIPFKSVTRGRLVSVS